ncbi:hypothetical protein L6452_21396 [Arctium lappa]|uniref:Uncharacterized protein n=1 Tax=Arctium lappa TaxID=4217 RepID=A0ACB9BEH3_ARCLA|nr:hypothetical protein L6452_21396 [Arctium lappa]
MKLLNNLVRCLWAWPGMSVTAVLMRRGTGDDINLANCIGINLANSIDINSLQKDGVRVKEPRVACGLL